MLTEVTNRLKGSGRWLVVPGGMRDVHVHFRDPGVPEAETRATGAQAAVVGGFTCVTTMPNTTPAGDNPEWLHEQIEDASLPVRIAPSACITKGRLGREVADLEGLAAAGAVDFSSTKREYREVLKPEEIGEAAFALLSVADRLEFLNGEMAKGLTDAEILAELGIDAKALGHYDCVFVAGEFREVPKRNTI